jgi:hypothetical protein
MKELESEKNLANALAILISSTRSKKRNKSLVEIADWIAFAVRQLGSMAAVGDRIGLSSQMLRQFESVNRLPAKVRTMFSERLLDSVDAAAHLAMLPPKDQLPVAQLLSEKRLDTSDVRAIHQLRKAGASETIGELIQKVETSKTRQEYIVEFIIRGSQDPMSVRSAIHRYFPSDQVIGLELEGATGRMILSKQGRSTLSSIARSKKVPLKSVMNAILQNR